MRILFVTNGVPLPPCGGHLLRAYHQMRLLSAQHQVDLVALVAPSRSNTPGSNHHEEIEFCKGALQKFCTRVKLVESSMHTRFATLVNHVSLHPSTASRVRKSNLPLAVARLLVEAKYDVVIFLLADVGLCLPKTYQGVAVLDMVDIFSVSFKYFGKASKSWFEKFWWRLDALKYVHFERSVGKHFAKILLVAKADVYNYSHITDRFGTNLDWVPHGVDTAHFSRPLNTPLSKCGILITGDLSHPANVEGIEYFFYHIFPVVIQQLPGVTLTIVGSRPKPSVLRLASKRVIVMSNVPDIRPYLFSARVSFCGVKLRMGTQTKILEAMAAGVPVVSTDAGNNGIEGINGTHLFFSDDPIELARSIVRLCTDDQLWNSMSQSAKDYVVDRFSWDNCATRLCNILEMSV